MPIKTLRNKFTRQLVICRDYHTRRQIDGVDYVWVELKDQIRPRSFLMRLDSLEPFSASQSNPVT